MKLYLCFYFLVNFKAMTKSALFVFILIISLFSCKQNLTNQLDKLDEQNNDTVDSVQLVKVWETDTLLTTAESVIFDEKRNVYFVSCINGVSPWVNDGDGFIAKLDLNGNILDRFWATGLSGPKGMAIKGDSLYVNDIDSLVTIDISTGKILGKMTVGDALHLNDMTLAEDGDLFVSDSNDGVIYKIAGDKASVLLQDTTAGGINGLFVHEDIMVFVRPGSGMLYTIQHGNLTPVNVADGLHGGDGIEKYKSGFFVSNWQGSLFYLDSLWQKTELLNSVDEKINIADIEVVEGQNLLLVPTFFDNRVVAYRIR